MAKCARVTGALNSWRPTHAARRFREKHPPAVVAVLVLTLGCGRTDVGKAPGLGVTDSAGTSGGQLTGSQSTDATTFGSGGFSATTSSVGGTGTCNQSSCDPSWSTPELVESDSVGNALHASVSMNRRGAAIVAWTHLDGARKNVWVNRYAPRDGWAGVEWLAVHDEDRVNVRAAIDDTDTIVLVWHAVGTPNLWSARHRPGAGWAAYESLGSISVAYPDVAVGARSTMVVWPEYDEQGATLWSRVAASSWESPIAVRTNVSLSDWRIAMNGTGDAMVVWREWDQQGRQRLWASRSSAFGWTPAEPLQPDTESGEEPDAAMDPEGNVIVAWHEWNGSGSSVRANRFTAGAGWDEPQRIGPALPSAQYARVGVDDAGNAIAIWQQADEERYTVWASRYSPASSWGSPEPISLPGGDAHRPELAVSATGDAVALWIQEDPSGLNLWSNRYVPGKGWGAAELVAPEMPDGVGCNDVAIDASGNALAVWCHNGDGPYSLWASFSRRPE